MSRDVIAKKYFTDSQTAAVFGLSLGGLRNKIYHIAKNPQTPARLPKITQVSSRSRLWLKTDVRAHLMEIYKDAEVVNGLMARGEQASPEGAGAGDKRKKRKA